MFWLGINIEKEIYPAAQLNKVGPKAYIDISGCRYTDHGGRKTGVPGDTPSDSDKDWQISAHVRSPGVDTGSVEVGGATDDHYANLIPPYDTHFKDFIDQYS